MKQMNIIEATKAAQEKGAYMKRTGVAWANHAKIQPTDLGYDVEITYPPNLKRKKERHPMWNPQTEDVLADDWVVCN